MPIFESIDDVADLKTYVSKLKKALGHVKPGAEKEFVYYKDFEIADKKIPCVLVDFATKCATELKRKFGAPTAAGTVNLTAQNELDFAVDKGSLKPKTLKKYFATLGGGLPDVLVDPNDSGSDSEGAAPAAPPTTPRGWKSAQPATPPSSASSTVPAAPPHVQSGTARLNPTAPTGVTPPPSSPIPASPAAPTNPTAPLPQQSVSPPPSPPSVAPTDDDIETRPRAARGLPPRPAALGPASQVPPPAQPPVPGVAPGSAPVAPPPGTSATTTTTTTTTTPTTAPVPAPPPVQPGPLASTSSISSAPTTATSTTTSTTAPPPPGTTATTSSTATTPPPVRPVAAAPAAPPPPANVGIPLPANEGEQGQLVDDFIRSLRGTDLPTKEPYKSKALNQAKAHADKGEYAEALKLLNLLVKNVSYPGVAAWALEPASRKYEVELLTEQLFAMTNLIKSKRRKPTDWDKEEKEILVLIGRITGVATGLKNALLTADPPKVKAAFDQWQPLVDEKIRLAGALKDVWKEDQAKRFRKETKKDQNHPNVKVAKAYGLDSLLELSQMAEIQAEQYKKDHPKDELAKGDWHKKLDLAELAAIYGYSTADYTAVAQVLRNKPPQTPKEQQDLAANQKKFADYIEAAKSGLEKLPVYKGGPVVRCTKSLWADTIQAIATSGVHVEQSFMSVGKKKVAGFGDIEWHFDKFKTGKEITMFSLHQSEGEILFAPGAKFKFIKGEVEVSGSKVTFIDHSQFATHVTPDTKAGKFWFEQV